MNERIRELAKQAGAVFEKTNGLNEFPQDSLVGDEIEKFAELIATECSNVAAQTSCPYEDESARQNYGHTWDMACVEAGRNIRKHFEVEK